MHTMSQIIEVYGPQLGELAWHALHVDRRLVAMSEQHAASIMGVVEVCELASTSRAIRILEIGAYAHYGGHLAAATLGGVAVAHDVSPISLRIGSDGARAAGIRTELILVAGDFHDLPFNTGYFDVVFCASSIHHTFRPWRVLQEALRVLRPGGALRLENEPVGRALCFYGFRSNRMEAFTPFEAGLAQRGTLFTFSSPFPGSRPEMLFGMTENERIPLDMFLNTLSAAGTIVSLQMLPQMGEFESRILALPRDTDLEAALTALLLAEIQAARPALTERDQLLGARLPDIDEVWRLSYQVAPSLRRLANTTALQQGQEIARLFGAALQATVVKHGHEVPHAEMFRRRVPKQDEVCNDLPTLPGVRLNLTAQCIPAIEAGDLATLGNVYPAADWASYREENGLLSMLNRGPNCSIHLPALPSGAILLLRFYAVAANQPYRISLRSVGEVEMTSVMVVQSESFLMRELLPARSAVVFIQTRLLSGNFIDLPRHVRLGVGRLIPVDLPSA